MRSLQSEIDIIRKLTGFDGDIKLNNNGYISRTYLIDNGRIVFKFPKSEAGKQEYAYEVPTLEMIKKCELKVKIPIINWSSPDNDYIGYYGVVGNATLQDELTRLSKIDIVKIGSAIGSFIKQLHSIEPREANMTMTVEEEIEKYQARYRACLPTINSYFSNSELLAIDNFYTVEMPKQMMGLAENPVFSHGDLGLYNLILMNDNEVGVIDFGDAGLYDESHDFICLEDETILEHAITAYGESEDLRKKVSIRLKALPSLELHYYISIGDESGIAKWIGKLRNYLFGNEARQRSRLGS